MLSCSQRGFALTLLLIISTIISFLVTQTYFSSTAILNLYGDIIHTKSAREKAKTKAIRASSLTSGVREYHPKMLCNAAHGVTGKQTLTRNLCVLSENTSISTNSLFNFNLIFKDSLSCKPKLFLSSDRTSSGIQLTPGSLVSNYLCTQGFPSNNQNIFKVKGNLELEEFAEQTGTLGASGYLEIDKLRLTTSLLIVSGGDLLISSIVNDNEFTAQLTLISATGIIRVSSVSGNIALQAYTPTDLYLPSEVQQSVNDIVLPVLKNQAVGFVVE